MRIPTTGLSHCKLSPSSTVHQPCRLADHTALLVLHSDYTSLMRCAHAFMKLLPRDAMHSVYCVAIAMCLSVRLSNCQPVR